MANIMSLKNVRNKSSRNGFDLSRRTCFTAKVGELLPVWWKYVLPGDSFTIDLSAFTRTQPVNTASYGRVREYYDFFFVPLEQLWNKSHTVLTQMNDNSQHSTGLNQRVSLNGDMPQMSISEINNYLADVYDAGVAMNIFSFYRSSCSAKLLSYLGYGKMYKGEGGSSGTGAWQLKANNSVVSLYPLLAYQKIYADFFRYTQWESPNPATFNVDWMNGTGDTTLVASQFTAGLNNNTMFDLRYCNYQKDLFHGIMPNAQFGSTAAVPINTTGNAGNLNVSKGNAISSLNGSFDYHFKLADGNYPDIGYNDEVQWAENGQLRKSATTAVASQLEIIGSPSSSSQFVTDVTLSGGTISSSSLSILALRQAEALQRWKEVAQAAEEDYKQQIQAHWGINVSDLLSGQCRYLGGINGNISVNEVVNTNLVSGDSAQPADLAGKGIGSQNGKITFNSSGEYGVIMCVYHALPLLDYITSGIDASLLHVDGASFPIPEMDAIGMELLPSAAFSSALTNPTASQLGYVPRYIDWKTDYDRCVGAFADKLQSWILPYTDENMYLGSNNQDSDNPNVPVPESYVGYPFFKVNPRIADVMFAVEASDDVNTDPLLCQSFFDVKVVRNLDVNGLPY